MIKCSNMFRVFMFSAAVILAKNLKADEGYFLHVTDFHWDHTYMGLDLSCNDVVESYGIYGDYWCDAPWKLVNSSVYAMKFIKPDVDFILWTGDNTPHTSDDNVNFEIHDALLGNLTNLLKDVFPNIPVYATLGNHDYYPHNQYPDNGNLLYNNTFERWKEWIGDTSSDTFLKGAYYTLKTSTGLRIVGLNTNLYYTSNKQVNGTGDPTGQFMWLDNTLLASKTANEKVLITGHISPGINPTGDSPWMYTYYNTRLNEIFEKYAEVIVGLHFGHEHSDNFRVYHDDNGDPIISQFCAPSVTPWRYKIPGRTGPAHNPSFRLLKYNRTTGEPLDYTQYYMNLLEVNRNNMSEWKIEYNATDAYNMTDLSPVSLGNLLKRMKDRKSVEFQSFYRFWTVSVDQQYQEPCDIHCHARYYCNFKHVEKDNFKRCKDELLYTSGSVMSSLAEITLFLCCVLLFS